MIKYVIDFPFACLQSIQHCQVVQQGHNWCHDELVGRHERSKDANWVDMRRVEWEVDFLVSFSVLGRREPSCEELLGAISWFATVKATTRTEVAYRRAEYTIVRIIHLSTW